MFAIIILLLGASNPKRRGAALGSAKRSVRPKGRKGAVMRKSHGVLLAIRVPDRRNRPCESRPRFANHPNCERSAMMSAAEGRGRQNGTGDGRRESRSQHDGNSSLHGSIPLRGRWPGFRPLGAWTPANPKKQASEITQTARQRRSSFGRTQRAHSTAGSHGACGEEYGEKDSRCHRGATQNRKKASSRLRPSAGRPSGAGRSALCARVSHRARLSSFRT
jgi:hypothetical protein